MPTPQLVLFMEQSIRPILLIYSAALAALSHFRSLNVLVAFDGDLAWYLLHAIRSPRVLTPVSFTKSQC